MIRCIIYVYPCILKEIKHLLIKAKNMDIIDLFSVCLGIINIRLHRTKVFVSNYFWTIKLLGGPYWLLFISLQLFTGS